MHWALLSSINERQCILLYDVFCLSYNGEPLLVICCCTLSYREEAECRFCSHKLPNWKAALRPKCTVTAPVVAVVYEGQEYRFRVEPTPEGQGRFMKEVEAMLGHPLGLHEVKFYCRAPTGV